MRGEEGHQVRDFETIAGGVGGHDLGLNDEVGVISESAGCAAQGGELEALDVYFDKVHAVQAEAGDLGIHGGDGDAGGLDSAGGREVDLAEIIRGDDKAGGAGLGAGGGANEGDVGEAVLADILPEAGVGRAVGLKGYDVTGGAD